MTDLTPEEARQRIVAEESDFEGYRLRVEQFEHAGFSAEILLPVSSEELIDEAEFGADERLPYWAELWPSARTLARHILEREQLPAKALELGAGIGLPSLSLLHRGVEVVATDYYPEALRFARYNACRNLLGSLRTASLDWRDLSAVTEAYPLVVAADVLYERRNADSLILLLPHVVAAGGVFLLADPGRAYLPVFLDGMRSAGWSVDVLMQRKEPSPAGKGLHVTVQLFSVRLSPGQAGQAGKAG